MSSAARQIQKPTLDGVHLRDGIEADTDFVRVSMQSAIEKYWPYRSPCDGKLLFKRLLALLPRLLARSHLLVAEKDGGVASFAIIDRHAPIVHWVQTSVPYRRMGLCKALLSQVPAGWTYSHDTQLGANAAKALGGKFDPYSLIFMEATDGEAS